MRKLVMSFVMVIVLASLLYTPNVVAAQEEMPREETLKFYGGPFTTQEVWNPFIPTEMHYTGLHALECLFYYNQYTGEVIPWQAESFTYTDNYTKIILKLRKGVRWNDGVSFTADDVVFTYNMLLKYAPELQYSPWVKENIKSVTKIDNYTVLFELKYRNPRAHYQMFYANWPIRIVPEHIWKDVDPTTFKNYPNPVMTGAFKVYHVDPTTVILKRDDNWWGKDVFGFLPHVKYIVFTEGDSSLDKQISDMIENKFDACVPSKSGWEAMSIRNPDLELQIMYDACPRGLQFNTLRYPFNLREVRWAIAYAVNRTKLNQVAYEGLSEPQRHHFPLYPGIEKYVFDDILDKYDMTVYDPEKSIEIFESLGWTRGPDGVWVTDNGTRLGPYELPVGWFPEGEYLAMSIAEDLRAIGIDIEYKRVEWIVFTDGIQRGLFDIWMGWACGLGIANAYDPWALYTIFHSNYTDVPIGEKIPLGMDTPGAGTRWHTDEFDDIIERLTAVSPDDPASIPIYRDALEYFMREMPMISFFGIPALFVWNNHYWTNWPTMENCYIHFFGHHATAYMIWVNLKSATMPPVTMKTVYATKDIERFLGVDLKMYGPFSKGEEVIVPSEDADRLVLEGLASYTKPVTGIEELVTTVNNLQSELAGIQEKISSLESKAASLESSIGTATTTSYMAIALAVVLGIIAIAISLRKSK